MSKDSLISVFEMMFGSGPGKKPGFKAAGGKYSQKGYTTTSDNNQSLSYIDNYNVSKEQQIEEYEKLFKVMNGPIENLVAFSRSSHQ